MGGSRGSFAETTADASWCHRSYIGGTGQSLLEPVFANSVINPNKMLFCLDENGKVRTNKRNRITKSKEKTVCDEKCTSNKFFLFVGDARVSAKVTGSTPDLGLMWVRFARLSSRAMYM